MANTRPRFFIYAPDNTEEGTLEKRLSVRAKHLETATANFGSGFVRTLMIFKWEPSSELTSPLVLIIFNG